jgi:cytochrome c553
MRKPILSLFGVMLVGLLAAGCTSGADDTTTSSDTSIPEPTTTTTAATTTTDASAAADASCVACHTDQATLQAMAVEPVASETLSEGEG